MPQPHPRAQRLILADHAHGPLLRKRWERIVATFTDPDLVAVILFCALGLLLTIALLRLLPG